MSISPPSDIVLDVARAADPTRYSQAAARLTRTPASMDAEFAAVLDAEPAPVLPPAAKATTAAGATGQTIAPDAAKAFEGFEAMALATMIESAMPENSSAVFGSGTAGSVWKSMLAEQIADQMAKAGGIGIAKQLASGTTLASAVTSEGAAARDLLVSNVERRFIGAAMPDASQTDTNG